MLRCAGENLPQKILRLATESELANSRSLAGSLEQSLLGVAIKLEAMQTSNTINRTIPS